MGKKLTVYMIDGTEYGPRIAEIGNWVGKGFYSPRAAINKVMTRPEFSKPGVYFLKSVPKSDYFSERIYIGEAENIGVRIKQHLNDPNKDFEELVFFVSNDHLLTKTQIKYLESRIQANMFETEQGFIVTKGSQANKNLSPSTSDTYKRLREKLIASGILLDKGNFFKFTEDTVFSSTSAASIVVLGRQSQGPIEWLNSANRTYKSLTE